METGERIRTLRNELKLTQAAFGEKIGVKGGVVSAWEKGTAKPPYGRILMICEKYGVNEEWLTSGVGTRRRPQTSSISLQDHVAPYVFAFLDHASQDTRRQALELCKVVLARYAQTTRNVR